jgi:hypothetical protein
MNTLSGLSEPIPTTNTKKPVLQRTAVASTYNQDIPIQFGALKRIISHES